ncbi:hypothetical protein D3C83_225480 [compost metagenome]
MIISIIAADEVLLTASSVVVGAPTEIRHTLNKTVIDDGVVALLHKNIADNDAVIGDAVVPTV